MSKIEKEREDSMKKTKKKLIEKQWNDTTNVKRYTRECSNCKVTREFKTLQGYKRSKNTVCKSCSNTRNAIPRIAKVINGMKQCYDCKQLLPTSNFFQYRGSAKTNQYHSLCNVCKKERFKHYQKTIGRFKRYGITKEIYEQMYNAQSGKCYICGIDGVKLHIDHNHTTGKVRSLLCKECNMALGLLKENVDTLNNMIEYLEKDGYESRSENPIRNNNVS